MATQNSAYVNIRIGWMQQRWKRKKKKNKINESNWTIVIKQRMKQNYLIDDKKKPIEAAVGIRRTIEYFGNMSCYYYYLFTRFNFYLQIHR